MGLRAAPFGPGAGPAHVTVASGATTIAGLDDWKDTEAEPKELRWAWTAYVIAERFALMTPAACGAV